MARSAYRKPVVTAMDVLHISYACDKCGTEIYEDKEPYANEVLLGLNQDECVSSLHRRDYCPDCLTEVWEAICAIIGADPDAEINEWAEDYNL